MKDKTPPTKSLAAGAARMSKRILLSYVIDWIIIIGLAGAGAGFNTGIQNTNKRPFSLQDPSLGYPFRPDTVTVTVLAIVALLVPAVITLVVSFVFIPGPTVSKTTPKSLVWRRKIWEWNTAWMGLGLSCASTFMITEGLKDLAGKPRPYAINKCRPNLNEIDQYRVGGLGSSFDTTGAVPILVSSDICQETDPDVLREIFASWPSGHSSFAWAGLLYLCLYLCAKFAVGIPYFKPSNYQNTNSNTYEYDTHLRNPNQDHTSSHSYVSGSTTHEQSTPQFSSPPPRNTTAAPPLYLLFLAVYLPIGTAIFVCVSRWFDFHHHGIDILTGAFIGAFCATFCFRYYHMPIRRGSGWSWGARSRGRAFWVGVGRDGYVGDEGWMAGKHARDIELGKSSRTAVGKDAVLGEGRADPGDVSLHGSRAPLQQGQTQTQNQTPVETPTRQGMAEQGYIIRNDGARMNG